MQANARESNAPHLEISSVRARRRVAIEQRKQLYDRLELQVIKAINMYAAAGATSCTHEVPMFVFGEPKYDIRECCEYIVSKMQARVRLGELQSCAYYAPNIIRCAWDM